MRKKVPEFFKNLFNLKSGHYIFLRFIVKFTFWTFVVLSMLYGLVYVPKQLSDIARANQEIQLKKVVRNCEIYASNSLNNVLAGIQAALSKAKTDEEKKKIKIPTPQEQKQYFDNVLIQCVELQGYDVYVDADSLMKRVQKVVVKNNVKKDIKGNKDNKKVENKK